MFDLKLCRIPGISKESGGKRENFAVTMDGQWHLELPSFLVDEAVSSVDVVVDKAQPRRQDEYDTPEVGYVR